MANGLVSVQKVKGVVFPWEVLKLSPAHAGGRSPVIDVWAVYCLS